MSTDGSNRESAFFAVVISLATGAVDDCVGFVSFVGDFGGPAESEFLQTAGVDEAADDDVVAVDDDDDDDDDMFTAGGKNGKNV